LSGLESLALTIISLAWCAVLSQSAFVVAVVSLLFSGKPCVMPEVVFKFTRCVCSTDKFRVHMFATVGYGWLLHFCVYSLPAQCPRFGLKNR
jgi:hypothetical protein